MMFSATRAFQCSLATLVAGALLAGAPVAAQAQDDELEGLKIEEIIVTARKRDESIQEVPVAVTAITSLMVDQMGLKDLDDIAKVTAGLSFDPEFSRTSNRPVIRGQANILGDSGVSYFIDGVYITGSINDYDINDVERIEVVKGPQSALYGRNTYSGAINIVTKSPGDSFSVRGRVVATDDKQQEYSATVKGPLGDSFGFGLTGRYYKLDGPWKNTFDGSDIGLQESTSMSAVAVFEPSDRFSARFRAYYAETRDGQPPLQAQPHSENNCFPDNGSLYGGGGRYFCGVLAPRPINNDWTVQAPDAANDRDLTQASLKLDFDITDNLSLTSITGYNKEEASFITEADYSPTAFQTAVFARFPLGFPFPAPWGYVGTTVDFTFSNADDIEDISQEFRLTWERDRSEYMIGAYYFDQEARNIGTRNVPSNAAALAGASYGARLAEQQAWCAAVPFLCTGISPLFGPNPLATANRNQDNNDIRNTAVFGMAAFDLTDLTTLTVEGRWAEEKKEQELIAQAIGGTPGTPERKSATFTSFNPRVTLDHRINDDQMVYALVAQGNKPGGFNGDVAALVGKGTFDEEEVVSVEIGSKNVSFDGQLVANLAVFFNQIEGYQLTENVRSGGNTQSATVNSGDAEVFGAELEMRYVPQAVEGLALTFNYAFTKSEFVKGEDENVGLLNDVADNGLADCSLGTQSSDPDECILLKGSIVGNQIPRTAEHQLFFDGEIRRPFRGGNWDWFLGANYSYESSKFAQVVNQAETGSTTLVNARLGFANDNFSVMLWGKNLTGEDSTPLALRYADGADDFKRNFVVSARRDTYWGITATAGFE